MSEQQPKPVESEDDVADEPDTSPEETGEVVEDLEANAEDPPSPFDGTEDTEQVELDLAETNIGEEVSEDDDEEKFEDSAFDGEEHATTGTSESTPTQTPSPTVEDVQQAVGGNLNAGAAQLAVVGLPDEFEHYGEIKQKSELRDEFEEIFETFRLGQFGEQVAEEYLFVDAGQIDPLTGFTISITASAAMVMMMRPDSDEILDKVTTAVKRE